MTEISSHKKIVLAIETSSKKAGISILQDGIEIANREFSEKESVSELLILKITDLLQQFRLEVSEIEMIAVSTGPGSLTGIRIGIAVARGLALALGVPCVGVSLWEAMKYLQPEDKNICCLIYSGGNNFYWQISGSQSVSEQTGDLQSLKEQLIEFPQSKIICDKLTSDKIQGEFQEILVICDLIGRVGLKGIEKGFEQTEVIPLYAKSVNFKKTSFE